MKYIDSVSCDSCKDSILFIPDGIMRSCQCGKSWIDYAKYYTRFGGYIIMERLDIPDHNELKLIEDKILN